MDTDIIYRTQFSTLKNELSGYFWTILCTIFVIILQVDVNFFYMIIWFVDTAPSECKHRFRMQLASCIKLHSSLTHFIAWILDLLIQLFTDWSVKISYKRWKSTGQSKRMMGCVNLCIFSLPKRTGSLVKLVIALEMVSFHPSLYFMLIFEAQKSWIYLLVEYNLYFSLRCSILHFPKCTKFNKSKLTVLQWIQAIANTTSYFWAVQRLWHKLWYHDTGAV